MEEGPPASAFQAQMQNHDTVASFKRRGHQQVSQKSRVTGQVSIQKASESKSSDDASKIIQTSPKSGAHAIPEINPRGAWITARMATGV